MALALKYRGKTLTVTLEDVVESGHTTQGGLVKWKVTGINYQARYYVKKIGNEGKLTVGFKVTSALTPTMKKELPEKVLDAIRGELLSGDELWVIKR